MTSFLICVYNSVPCIHSHLSRKQHVSGPTITQKNFETNASFHVK